MIISHHLTYAIIFKKLGECAFELGISVNRNALDGSFVQVFLAQRWHITSRSGVVSCFLNGPVGSWTDRMVMGGEGGNLVSKLGNEGACAMYCYPPRGSGLG